MKYSIIDIGSNSMRFTLYETDGSSFKILFRDKFMAGLAGYVDDGILTKEGIACAIYGLMNFRHMSESLNLPEPAVFATASLRNIANSESAVNEINTVTGYKIDVLSGRDEALMGYTGAMREIKAESGAFTDIGGASTEVVIFENGTPSDTFSFNVGSLSLYRSCVKNIIPGPGSQRRINKTICSAVDEAGGLLQKRKHSPIIGVGGTARAVMKLSRKVFGLNDSCCRMTAEQLSSLCSILLRADKTAADLILKLETDRIHTMIPGLMILQHLFTGFGADEFLVSSYGVREGYLCQRILKKD